MSGLAILGWGSYLPRFQLRGHNVAAVLGTEPSDAARGVASYDEDAVTMGVAAAARALAGSDAVSPASLVLATSTPPYLVKNCASTVHAALGLAPNCRATDAGGATRSGATALLAACGSTEPTLVVSADLRAHRAGSPGELAGGDAAAAFLIGPPGPGAVPARVRGWASRTVEVMDRWRLPTEPFAQQADERSTEQAYLSTATGVLHDLAERTGTDPGTVHRLVIATEHRRVRQALPGQIGIPADRVLSDIAGLGCAGAAQAAVLLATTLEEASPGELILLLAVADGADALLVEAGALPPGPGTHTVRAQVARARPDLNYATYLAWRGLLERDPARRPPPAAPAPAPALRNTAWKYSLHGSKCRRCGTAHLPPQRLCRTCRALDEMDRYPIADQTGTVVSVTTDWLGWSPQPPLIHAIVAFDGGGQLRCEVGDARDGELRPGDRAAMAFRVLRTVDGVHNYFWKAVPA